MDDSIDKKWLSYDEQLELLSQRGMLIEDPTYASEVLSCVSYYRLSGYFRYWQKDPDYGDDTFIEGTSFNRIFRLYQAEANLANICKSLLATCELVLRTRFAHYYGEHVAPTRSFAYGKGFTTLSSGRREPIEERILSDLDRSKDLFVDHYRQDIKQGYLYKPEAYDKMPIWVAVEALSFGTLSRMIEASGDSGVLDAIADSLNTTRKLLPSQVRSFVYLRNRTSHYGRLWNMSVPDAPFIQPNTKRRIREECRSFKERSIYEILVALHDLAQRAGICEDLLGLYIEPLLKEQPLLAYGISTPERYGKVPLEVLLDDEWARTRTENESGISNE